MRVRDELCFSVVHIYEVHDIYVYSSALSAILLKDIYNFRSLFSNCFSSLTNSMSFKQTDIDDSADSLSDVSGLD